MLAPMMCRFSPFLAVIAVLVGPLALAQNYLPVLPDSGRATYGLEFSHSLDAPISRGDRELGDLNTMVSGFRYLRTLALDGEAAPAGPLGETPGPGSAWSLRLGMDWQRFDFSLPDGAPMPDMLQSLALKVGVNWQFAEKWAALLEADPGLYSDFEDIGWSDVNVPVGMRFTYSPNRSLTWVFGLRYDAYNELPVLPGLGVRWRMDDHWTLSLMMPRPRLEYAWTDRLMLFAGGEFKGGGYRVAEDFGRRRGEPQLDDEQVTYREIRVGGGLRYRLARLLRLTVEGGWAVDRRFVFDDADLQFNGDGAPYIQIGLGGSY